MSSIRARCCAVVFAGFFAFGPLGNTAPRPLPEDVAVKAIAKKDRDRLELLVRVPLAAVKDVQFPTRGDSGYLDLSALKSMLPGAARYWIADCFEVQENGVPATKPAIVGTRVSLNSDPSFDSYQDALDHINSPDIPADTNVSLDQVWLDIQFEYSLHSDHAVIALRPKLAGLGVRVATNLKYVDSHESSRDFSFEGDPGLIYLDARLTDTAKQFLQWGFHFILSSGDVLLFLFCLALPLRRYWEIAPAAIAFAGALAITLLVCAFGMTPDSVWLRPLMETLSAVSILLLAFANIIGHVTPRRRTLLALGSGFVFGFICLFDFNTKVQFGGAHTIVSAVLFGSGAVFAIAILIALLVPILTLLFRYAKAERVEMIVFSALAADTAWGWLGQRWGQLSKVPLQAFVFDAHLLALTLRCLTVLVLFGGALWFTDEWLKSRQFPPAEFSPKQKSGNPI